MSQQLVIICYLIHQTHRETVKYHYVENIMLIYRYSQQFFEPASRCLLYQQYRVISYKLIPILQISNPV
jgi:hypothetical protein